PPSVARECCYNVYAISCMSGAPVEDERLCEGCHVHGSPVRESRVGECGECCGGRDRLPAGGTRGARGPSGYVSRRALWACRPLRACRPRGPDRSLWTPRALWALELGLSDACALSLETDGE